MTCSIRRLLVTIAACVLFAIAMAPAGFAGEDTDTTGGSDGGAAGGGAGTGAGGTATSSDSSLVVPFALAGGGLGLVLLTFGAGSLRRRSEER
jgi:hypothetical protein